MNYFKNNKIFNKIGFFVFCLYVYNFIIYLFWDVDENKIVCVLFIFIIYFVFKLIFVEF